MIKKLVLALALTATAITTIVPASARPGDASYSSGYEDEANNRTGW
jgi:hypothetical protein